MEKEKPQVRDVRNGDWLWINKLVLEHPYIANSAKLVYSALAYFANNNTQEAFPSFETIMQLTGLKRRVITTAIKQLEEYYFIQVERDKGKVNQYILLKLTDSTLVQNVHRAVQNRTQEVCRMGPTNNTNLTTLNINKRDINNIKRLKELKVSFLKKSVIPNA